MENTLGRSGVPTHETFKVFDSSKIQAFMDCPRGFFYSYILGWRKEEPNIHLVFGSAWHEAMEHLLTHGHTPEHVQEAYQKFLKVYQESFDTGPFAEAPYPGKGHGNALKALSEYAGYWSDDPANTLYTEIAGTAPIREDRVIHFKMDTIRKRPRRDPRAGKLYSLEHKTTSRAYSKWFEKWSYLFQIRCYNYALYTLVDDPQMWDGVDINGAVLRKKSNEFKRIPVKHSMAMLEDWLYEANYYIDQIEYHMELLAESSPSDRIMVAFPRNSMSCSKFGCKYYGYCNQHANPLQHKDRVPLDMCVDYWDPRRKEKEAKNVVHLEDSKEVKTKEEEE